MFNIEKAISGWRKEMLAAGVKNLNALNELQEHLLSDVDAQMRSGTEAETAFSQAVQRIGSPSEVCEEFAKFRSRPGAAFESWYLVAAVLLIIVAFFGTSLVFAKLRMDLVQRIVGFLGLVVIVLIACTWRRALPYLPMVPEQRRGYAVIFLWLTTAALTALAAFGVPNVVIRLAEEGLIGSNGLVVALIWSGVPMAIAVCVFLAWNLSPQERARWGMRGRSTLN